MLGVKQFPSKPTIQVENTFNNNLQVYSSLEEIIPQINNPSPMVLLSEKVNPNPEFKIFLKLEYMNPFGSIKDRIALYMLKKAKIEQGQTLLEASSGNTAIALACLANAYGIAVEIAVPERIPEAKKKILKLLGVTELWEADDDLCPIYPNEGARGVANGLINSEGGERFVHVNQYENMANVEAHYETTGPEIFNQTNRKISHFFSSIGTGGTISGVGKFLKEKNENVQVIGVEPSTDIHKLYGMKRISTLPPEYYPKIIEPNVIDSIEAVTDDQAYTTLRTLIAAGYPVGVSTAAVVKSAIDYAINGEHQGIAVVIAADSIFNYSSVLPI